ncbi:MAG: hypothetical protein GXP54_06540 [Deltaproteobacteria bacterium]|nr:hypothetical protein [Deltaproteobacteria bacterium]
MKATEVDISPWNCDDDLIEAVRNHGRSAMRVHHWDRVEVVIGRGGKADVELRLDQIRSDCVPVLRRRGGGCAVVLDPGNIIVSVVLPLPGVFGIKASFRRISEWLIRGLADAGVPGVSQRGASDLTLDDRKVGGACIFRSKGLLYYSTTLLAAPDVGLVDRYLKHPPREPDYRLGRTHSEFMGRLMPDSHSTSVHDFARSLEKKLSIGSIARII